MDACQCGGCGACHADVTSSDGFMPMSRSGQRTTLRRGFPCNHRSITSTVGRPMAPRRRGWRTRRLSGRGIGRVLSSPPSDGQHGLAGWPRTAAVRAYRRRDTPDAVDRGTGGHRPTVGTHHGSDVVVAARAWQEAAVTSHLQTNPPRERKSDTSLPAYSIPPRDVPRRRWTFHGRRTRQWRRSSATCLISAQPPDWSMSAARWPRGPVHGTAPPQHRVHGWPPGARAWL